MKYVPGLLKRKAGNGKAMFGATDTETGGLDKVKLENGLYGFEGYQLLELCLILLDDGLNEVNRFHVTFQFNPDIEISKWALNQHTESGLLERCKNSSNTPHSVDTQLFDFLTAAGFTRRNQMIMLGNSVNFDRGYILHNLPLSSTLIHFRVADVSSLRILTLMTHDGIEPFKKNFEHLADADIKECIDECNYYFNALLQSPAGHPNDLHIPIGSTRGEKQKMFDQWMASQYAE